MLCFQKSIRNLEYRPITPMSIKENFAKICECLPHRCDHTKHRNKPPLTPKCVFEPNWGDRKLWPGSITGHLDTASWAGPRSRWLWVFRWNRQVNRWWMYTLCFQLETPKLFIPDVYGAILKRLYPINKLKTTIEENTDNPDDKKHFWPIIVNESCFLHKTVLIMAFMWLTVGPQPCSRGRSGCRWSWRTAAGGSRPGRPPWPGALYDRARPPPAPAAGTPYWGSEVSPWSWSRRSAGPPRRPRPHLESRRGQSEGEHVEQTNLHIKSLSIKHFYTFPLLYSKKPLEVLSSKISPSEKRVWPKFSPTEKNLNYISFGLDWTDLNLQNATRWTILMYEIAENAELQILLMSTSGSSVQKLLHKSC